MFEFRISFIILLFFWGLISCDKEKTSPEDNIETKFSIDKSFIEAPSDFSSYSVQIISNTNWTVESNVGWIRLTSASKGEKGVHDISFDIEENNESEEREGELVFKSDDEKTREVLKVSQQSKSKEELYVRVGGTGNGTSWNDATNLDNALEIAKEGNIIHISEGVYVPSVIIRGGDESDPGERTFFISKNITLIGGYPADSDQNVDPNPDKYSTVLSGEDKVYHVVTINAPSEDKDKFKVRISGVTITGGY